MKIKKGDIVLPGSASGGEGKISFIIAKASHTKSDKGPTRSTHVDIVSKGGRLLKDNMDGIEVSGITYPQARTADMSIYKGARVLIYRLKSADQEQMSVMMQTLKNYVAMGKKYGVWNIILHGLDAGLTFLLEKIPGVIFDLRPFTALFFGKKAICSSLVADLYDTYFSVRFGRAPRLIQPDDIDKHCKDSKAFELIYDGVIR